MSEEMMLISILASHEKNSVTMPDREDVIRTVAVNFAGQPDASPSLVARATYDYIWCQLVALAKARVAKAEESKGLPASSAEGEA